MSRNGSGTYTRPIVSGVIAGDDILASEYNSEIDDISTALTDSVSRSGKGALQANLDAGGYKITNLGAATANGQAVRYDEFTSSIAGKASSGVNTDITSLAAPALGAATATTQAVSDDSTKVATTAFVQDLADLLCPPGTIIAYSGTTAPTGFLECPTTQTNISRTTYARLFAAIGTTWGSGDGSTTFGVPWVPGDYALLQAGVGSVGTATTGEVISHSHSYVSGSGAQQGYTVGGATFINSSATTGATGGSFNKAAGHRVLYCVKI
jgi:microcystin-dependent protein